uniref:Arrestin_N domain-containing protein n=1 Tax=Ascaris lumbricoides TaxID=6252 RepID=A0A0M3HWX2_ASCLU
MSTKVVAAMHPLRGARIHVQDAYTDIRWLDSRYVGLPREGLSVRLEMSVVMFNKTAVVNLVVKVVSGRESSQQVVNLNT